MRRTVLLLVAVFLVSAAMGTAPALADSERLCNNRCASDNDTTINNDNDVDNSVENNIDNSVENNTTNNTTNNVENCTNSISGNNNTVNC